MRHGPVSNVRRLIVLTTVATCILTSVASGATRAHTSTSTAPRIVVSSGVVIVDHTFSIRVTGLPPQSLVDLSLTLRRGDGTYTSHATFRADKNGRVDLARTAPVAGDYSGVDAMGLIWFAHQVSTTPPADLAPWTDSVDLRADVAGREVAQAHLTRFYVRPGDPVEVVRAQGLVGTFFRPAGHRRRPGVIVVGGSEGGIAFSEIQAALLASHGYNALALAYFDPTGALGGGLPRELSRIPLEYFGTAIDWLSQRPTVNPRRLAFLGASRGGELALLLASRYPQLRAVVAKSPSSVAWSSIDLDNFGGPAWTEHGTAVPYLVPKILPPPAIPFDWWGAALDEPSAAAAAIPVERINGPIMLIVGSDDRLWPSPRMATQITDRLAAFGHPYRDRLLEYAGAGHAFTVPYSPVTGFVNPGLGGTAVVQAAASQDQWRATLHFLRHQLRATRASS